jgi:hypothetical protein
MSDQLLFSDRESMSCSTWIRPVVTRDPRSVNERDQSLRDCMNVGGRITHRGVPVPFTQGNPRAVKWVCDRTDWRLNKTLNEGKLS